MNPSDTTATRSSGLFDVAGRSLLIVGATGALGQVATRTLAAAGARLTLSGGSANALADIAAEAAQHTDVVTVERRPDSAADADAIVAAARQHGPLTGVLVTAGTNHVSPITDMDVEDFERVMDVNVRGSWLIARAAGRTMLTQGIGGSVVLVSSTRGKLGHPAGYSAYCPSKGAVDSLTKTLAAEWGADGIRVNALAPTVFRSELTAWMYADDDKGRAVREAMFARIPLGRFAEPDDFAGALIYLLSDASAFVTGQVLYLDGGYTAC